MICKTCKDKKEIKCPVCNGGDICACCGGIGKLPCPKCEEEKFKTRKR